MNENKEYLTREQENGSVNISEEVIASIAGIAVGEVDGVAGLSSIELADKLGRKSLSKGIKILIENDTLRIDCYILVKFGSAIIDVAKAVQEKVGSAVESMTGAKVDTVNVSVGGIVFDREARK